jgi:hypothetical protein
MKMDGWIVERVVDARGVSLFKYWSGVAPVVVSL